MADDFTTTPIDRRRHAAGGDVAMGVGPHADAQSASRRPPPIETAFECPHWHMTEDEAVALVADLSRPRLLQVAAVAASLAASRDARQGYELPNRNALLVATAALGVLLYSGPRLVAVPGGAA